MVSDELKQKFDVITGLTLYLPLLVAAAQRSGKHKQFVAHNPVSSSVNGVWRDLTASAWVTGGTALHDQV